MWHVSSWSFLEASPYTQSWLQCAFVNVHFVTIFLFFKVCQIQRDRGVRKIRKNNATQIGQKTSVIKMRLYFLRFLFRARIVSDSGQLLLKIIDLLKIHVNQRHPQNDTRNDMRNDLRRDCRDASTHSVRQAGRRQMNMLQCSTASLAQPAAVGATDHAIVDKNPHG